MICTNYQVSCIPAATNLDLRENSHETVIQFLGSAAFLRVGQLQEPQHVFILTLVCFGGFVPTVEATLIMDAVNNRE
jgi:hypothetical protein